MQEIKINTSSLPEELQERQLTPRQQAFLDVLFEEAGGNVRTAMDMAGFAKSTKTIDIAKALHQEIAELNRQYMALYGPEAISSLLSVLRDPTQPGANVRMNTAEKILDRAGVSKGEHVKQEGQIQNIFILPPKGYKQESDMSPLIQEEKEESKVIDVEFEETK